MQAGTLLLLLGLIFSPGLTLLAQSNVRVELEEVTDNRIAAEMISGSLQLRLKLTGNSLEKASATRILVKDARDDKGTVLSKADDDPPDFQSTEYNSGTVTASLAPPVRSASSVKMRGTVELFVPSRDPNANIKVEKALSKLDSPLSSKALKAAKLAITPLSPARYAAMLKERKLDETKIAAIRAEGKARGVPEKEIELMIGLAQAMQEMDGPPEEGSVILSGSKRDFDRIYRVEVLGSDGQPIDVSMRSMSSQGDQTLMTLVPKTPPPANATLQLTLLTDKSRMSFPFELVFDLP